MKIIKIVGVIVLMVFGCTISGYSIGRLAGDLICKIND